PARRGPPATALAPHPVRPHSPATMSRSPVTTDSHYVRGDRIVRVPDARIALATSSVYPESTATAFELAARLGYDGVELTVSVDALSQDVDAVERLRDYHGLPVVSLHAPCFLVTPRVWGADP